MNDYDLYGPSDCDLCGERLDWTGTVLTHCEIGEFVSPDGEHCIAHAQCGLDAGYPLA